MAELNASFLQPQINDISKVIKYRSQLYKRYRKTCLTNFEFDDPFQGHLVSVKPTFLIKELLHVEWVFKNKYVFILKKMEKASPPGYGFQWSRK